MLRARPFADLPIYKLILGFSLCTLGGAMLYTFFKMNDDDKDDKDKTTVTVKTPKKNSKEINENNDDDICESIHIANDHIPIIMGRSGSNLELIEETTKTTIKIRDTDNDNIYCDITGKPEGVKLACDYIMKDIKRMPIFKEELWVPENMAYKFIERNSKKLEEISRNSLAKVKYYRTNIDPRIKLVIIGNQRQINIALKLIEDEIGEAELLQRQIEEVEQKREPRRSPANSSKNSSICGSQNSICLQALPRDRLLDARTDQKSMEVYVSAVATPTRFWVQLVGPQSKQLDGLVREMTEYYNNPTNQGKHEVRDPYVGQIVAGVFKYDDKWYRAEIVDISPNQYKPHELVIDIYFVDYGDSEYVELSDIRELRTDFLTLRFQAVECFLANVKSTNASPNTWQKHSISKFEELTEVANWKKLIARVVTYKERVKSKSGTTETTPIPGVELYDPSDGVEINIGNTLISQGLALSLDGGGSSSRPLTPANSSGSNWSETSLHVDDIGKMQQKKYLNGNKIDCNNEVDEDSIMDGRESPW